MGKATHYTDGFGQEYVLDDEGVFKRTGVFEKISALSEEKRLDAELASSDLMRRMYEIADSLSKSDPQGEYDLRMSDTKFGPILMMGHATNEFSVIQVGRVRYAYDASGGTDANHIVRDVEIRTGDGSVLEMQVTYQRVTEGGEFILTFPIMADISGKGINIQLDGKEERRYSSDRAALLSTESTNIPDFVDGILKQTHGEIAQPFDVLYGGMTDRELLLEFFQGKQIVVEQGTDTVFVYEGLKDPNSHAGRRQTLENGIATNGTLYRLSSVLNSVRKSLRTKVESCSPYELSNLVRSKREKEILLSEENRP